MRRNTLFLLALFALAIPAVFAQESPPIPATHPVKISFLPPPMRGTISLGIYDEQGKLVRILHREAQLDDFTVGPDALRTTWDGKNEAGEALPPGKYSARGYVVADLQVGDPIDVPAETLAEGTKVKVRLIANPLNGNERRTLEVAAGFDEDASYLQTADGLPLYTVDEMPGIVRVSIAQRPDKSFDLLQDDGDSVAQFHITGAEKMMAFDCGDFELK